MTVATVRLASGGVGIEVPRGWDVQIRGERAASATTATATDARDAGSGPQGIVLHAGSFPLPADRGDFGSGAVERMIASDVLVCLLEYGSEDATTELFRRESLPELRAAHFSPSAMQRTIHGMCGTQQFFHRGSRAFCLYVVLGSYRARGALVKTAAPVVRSLVVE